MATKRAQCPNCDSLNVQIMGTKKKGFSVGKAVVGGVLTGGIGLMAGFIGKKKGYDFYCGDCGNTFVVKKQ